MKIAIIGGGASGMVTAYLLDKYGHQVTVFEKQPILGGHIRTTHKNVQITNSNPDKLSPQLFLEGGVLEFPVKFTNFLQLMAELGVELEPVNIASSLFMKDGRHILSGIAIQKNYTGWQRLIEYLRLDTMYARSAGLWLKTNLVKTSQLHNQSMADFLKSRCIRNDWLKLLTMYSYSMPFELIDNFPAELAIPALRDYVYTDWVRIKGGVYSYIEKILAKFTGNIQVNAEIIEVLRTSNQVKIELKNGTIHTFDKVVFATPPDQVMKLLSDPSELEIKCFSKWEANQATTILHTDTSMYERYGIKKFSEFDFFQTESSWGYNAYLNQLCGVSSPQQYSLAFNLDSLIDKDKIIHSFTHYTPLYTVPAFEFRDEIIAMNGTNHTYYVGAYLGDGLHEGAITSAIKVAKMCAR